MYLKDNMERQLTKREYLGEGYLHFFIHDKTQEWVVVECTQEEYEALGKANPKNPTLEECTWHHSAGGTIKVDTKDTLLGEDEYCIKGEEVFIVLKDVPETKQVQILPKSDVALDGTFDEIKIK